MKFTPLGDTTTSTTYDDVKPSIRDRSSCKVEVSVPTFELLEHERRIKEEDYKKLDKMKNVKIHLQVFQVGAINHLYHPYLAKDKESGELGFT